MTPVKVEEGAMRSTYPKTTVTKKGDGLDYILIDTNWKQPRRPLRTERIN